MQPLVKPRRALRLFLKKSKANANANATVNA